MTGEFSSAVGLDALLQSTRRERGASEATAAAPPETPPTSAVQSIDFSDATFRLLTTLDKGVSAVFGLDREPEAELRTSAEMMTPYLEVKSQGITGERALLLLAVAGALSYGVAKVVQYAERRLATQRQQRPDVAHGGAPGDPLDEPEPIEEVR